MLIFTRKKTSQTAVSRTNKRSTNAVSSQQLVASVYLININSYSRERTDSSKLYAAEAPPLRLLPMRNGECLIVVKLIYHLRVLSAAAFMFANWAKLRREAIYIVL